MNIKLSELREVTAKIFDHLEEIGYSEITIPSDYYWELGKDQRYNIEVIPDDFGMGQLSDDWSELQDVLKDDDLVLSYALVWLASILRSVGEEVVG